MSTFPHYQLALASIFPLFHRPYLISVPVVPYPGNRTVPPVRQKRQITQPDAGVRVIQAAIFADARIMQR